MVKRCHTCRYCKSIKGQEPYDVRCMKNNGLVTRYNVCDWFEYNTAKCKDCRFCSFEPNSCDPEQIIGYCMQQQYASSLGEEYISTDTIACCEFKKK